MKPAQTGDGSAEVLAFDVERGGEGLRRRSVRGGMVTLASQVAKVVIGTGATVILARVLTPEDFGLIAMVAPVTGFIGLFKDLGLSMATVQRETISPAQVNALFWINVAASLALTVVTVAIAPLVGAFFEDPRVVLVTMVFAGFFVLEGLTAQHQALIRRRMLFGRLAVVEIAALMAGIASALLGAWSGLGYWALVLMQGVSAATSMVLTWRFAAWRPGWPRKDPSAAAMLRFGGGLTGFNVVNYLARNLDNVLIGRFLGGQALGLYSRAYGLLLLPIQLIRSPLSAVAIPVLSRLQHDPTGFRSYVRRALGLVTFASMPLVGFSAAAAEDVVLLLLGPQWTGAVPVFRILALAALVQSFNVVTGWVYTALGQTTRWFRWGLFSATVTVASFVIGLTGGIEGVALAYTTAVYILLVPSLAFCFRVAPLDLRDVLIVIWQPLLATGLGVLVLAVVRSSLLPAASLPISVAYQVLVFAGAYLLSWALLPGGLGYLRQLAHMLSRAMAKEEADYDAGVPGRV